MRYIFYNYNEYGNLAITYYDENGKRHKHLYMGYTLKEAIQLLRKEHNIKNKHVTIKSLN